MLVTWSDDVLLVVTKELLLGIGESCGVRSSTLDALPFVVDRRAADIGDVHAIESYFSCVHDEAHIFAVELYLI